MLPLKKMHLTSLKGIHIKDLCAWAYLCHRGDMLRAKLCVVKQLKSSLHVFFVYFLFFFFFIAVLAQWITQTPFWSFVLICMTEHSFTHWLHYCSVNCLVSLQDQDKFSCGRFRYSCVCPAVTFDNDYCEKIYFIEMEWIDKDILHPNWVEFTHGYRNVTCPLQKHYKCHVNDMKTKLCWDLRN